MAEDKELVTIRKSTLQWLVVVVIALVIGFGVGRFTAPTGSTVQGSSSVLAPSQPSQPSGDSGAGPVKFDVSVDDDPSIGDQNAKVTIIEFSDFECPFCSRFFTQTLPQIDKEYISTGKVRLVYRDFPLNSIHPSAQKAAEAAECADEQGKWKAMHDWLFGSRDQWAGLGESASVAKFKEAAPTLGLNAAQFDSCLDSGKYKDEVDKDFQDGSNAGVSGTPSFFINGQQVVGAQPYSVFKQIIDRELAA
ncbi:MAG: DsbA family protein [Candidatus Aenigmarchaeota archaeon]|nr:DsbA family protein [Candidatus Aenigmarchaeota archaeon]